MKILITGSKGFVGSFIVKYLANKHIILAPSSNELDLTNLEQVETWFKTNEVDVIIHCALSGREVLSSTDPIYLSDGLLMFRNLWLQRNLYKRFINLGTAFEFDLTCDNNNVKEYDFINHLPKTSYGYAKNIVARIIKDTEHFYNLKLFGIFHESENNNRFFQRIKTHDEVIINNDIYLDYMYLPDILPMIEVIVEGQSHDRDVNMVYTNKYRLSELAYYLCEQLNIDQNKIKISSHDGFNLTGNDTILSSYNFPSIGIHQGLRNYK